MQVRILDESQNECEGSDMPKLDLKKVNIGSVQRTGIVDKISQLGFERLVLQPKKQSLGTAKKAPF